MRAWWLVIPACAACGPSGPDDAADRPPAWFTEESAARGIDFAHASGHDGRYLFPEGPCGGAALFDMDGDGDLDAYLVQAGGITVSRAERPGNRLYENDGSGRFVDVTEDSGADDRGYGMGVATGDYDGDGDLDLYVTNLERNTLLRNDGGGQFTDVTAEAGVGERTWSASAAFFDYDRDGDLDLFVVNYVFWTIEAERSCYMQPHGETYCGPKSYDRPTPDTLYRNEGDGTFSDVSEELGILSEVGNGLGIGISDFDGDGWLDVFVANDATKDHLWINKQGRGFAERATLFACAADQDGSIKAGMGVAIVDLDDDADEDLLVVNLEKEYDSLFVNEGTVFADRTVALGLSSASQRYTRFGVCFQDFDQDGWPDVYEANGRVMHGAGLVEGDPFAEENLLFRGGPKRFEVVQPTGGVDPPLVATSRGAAFGDVDGDGGVDILVVNRDGPVHLLINRVARGEWIRFRVLEGGRDALGAALRIEAGGRRPMRRVRTSTSYCSANDPRVHLGLGDVREVREVRVTWVDGTEETFGPFLAGREHTLARGGGR